MSKEKEELNKVFVLEDVFPDVEGLLYNDLRTLKKSYKNAIFVLDTNILLRPYELKKETIDEIRTVYGRLISDSRLFIPERVIREFSKNRAKKLSEIHSNILNQKTKNSGTRLEINYPILETLPEKKELDQAIIELKNKTKEIIKKIDSLAERIKEWEWSDPVYTLYRNIFKKSMFVDTKLSRKDIAAELYKRREHKLPPGYKDADKDDSGVGDLIIWLSILELGEDKNTDIVFVTEDSKPDWWQKSGDKAFLPRFELVDEFRRKTSGNTLYIINFSKFLELGNASSAAVEDSKRAEKRFSDEEQKIARKRRFMRIFLADRYRDLDNEQIINEIKAWFRYQFENPAEHCPFDSKEGGYVYVFGGPYDAREEIEFMFGGIVDEEVIDEVASELESESLEWSRKP
jgi:rRNA-processing protein FCF1